MRFHVFLAIGLSLLLTPAFAQGEGSDQREGDYVIENFRFADGESLPQLRMHYTTLGTPKRDAAGRVVNAVLLLHGTSGSSKTWLIPSLAGELFAKGDPLDAARYFIILPDSIGSGGSSKPSDGLRTRFPHFRYRDIVEAEHRVIVNGLGITHVRLVGGSSMGGMQTWMWGEMFPGFMDGLMPIASQPIGISGRNWIARRIAIEAIKNDPDWHGGNYTTEPTHWIVTAPFGALMTENAGRLQEQAPTRGAADALYEKMVDAARKRDANDALYITEAVEDYDPAPDLGKIEAKLFAINSADDMVNPADLVNLAPAIAKIPGAKYAIIPESDKTHGHYTHLRATLWKRYLVQLLAELPPLQ
jgi:homoserine O-acetyltransferase/O-succinyltransferase